MGAKDFPARPFMVSAILKKCTPWQVLASHEGLFAVLTLTLVGPYLVRQPCISSPVHHAISVPASVESH